ncbi:hypothetical protein [Micromonospora sp. WMMD736]|uniref:hypothetical protein n=1 Tax=Micromonospora sp. WMMD736 TaxID=3404112 RepID=UPI003B964CC1
MFNLATSGSAALVGAAATDLWLSTRDGFQRVLSRGDPVREQVLARRLAATAAAVEQAAPQEREQVRQQLQRQWCTRLTDLLEEDPTVGKQLQALTDEVAGQLPALQQRWVQRVTASGPNSRAYVSMFGNVVNHFGALDPPTGPRE